MNKKKSLENRVAELEDLTYLTSEMFEGYREVQYETLGKIFREISTLNIRIAQLEARLKR